MEKEIEFERALLNFEYQLGALSTACENLKVVFSPKHVKIFVEEPAD